MEHAEIPLIATVILLLIVFIIHQNVIFARMIRQNRKLMENAEESRIRISKQNSEFLQSADHRLDKANEMVLTLAHSADSLASSIQHLKDMMVHLEEIYTQRNTALSKNRDEIMSAYTKLLKRYEELQDKHDQLNKDMFGTLQELARRPTIANNNLPQTQKIK